MNLSPNGDWSTFLNADEASAIEMAVRTTVMTILKVFSAVDEKRAHCYEVKLAETEKENAELKFQLKAAEQELITLRQISSDYKISAEVTLSHDTSTDVTEEAAASSQSEGRLVIKEEPSSEITLCLKREIPDETFAAEYEYPVVDNSKVCRRSEAAEMWNMEYLQRFSSERSSSNPTAERPGAIMAPKKAHPLSNKERQQRWRDKQRANPEAHTKYLAAEKKRRQNRKDAGKIKTIADMTEKEKWSQRRRWRHSKRKQKAKLLKEKTGLRTVVHKLEDCDFI